MPVSLAIPDLFAAPDPAQDPPALPLLDRLLAWGDARVAAPDWRAGVAEELGLAAMAARPCAQVAAWALAVPPPAEQGVVLATPVHCVPGISRVNLHPAGVLQLMEDEALALCESFRHALGGGDLALVPVRGGLLLQGEKLRDVTGPGDGDPARLQGATLVPQRPGQADPLLQRLAAEIQMWLHEHPLNVARVRRGALAITGLWLWGAGRSAARPEPRVTLPVAHAEDPWISGLWSACGARQRRAAARYAELESPDALAVTTVTGVLGSGASLGQLEQDWFGPLLEALQARTLPALTLHLGAHRWHIRRRRGLRNWRRPQPWWRLAA